MSESSRRIALVGSWADGFSDRSTLACELASAWPSDDRLVVFGDAERSVKDSFDRRLVTFWPEGSFGRHFTRHEFDHTVLMIGARHDSIMALGRAVDEGCHVWLQDDVLDVHDSPIDTPVEWLSEVVTSARSIIVGSDWLAGTVRRIGAGGPPVLVMPPAHPRVEPIVETPDRTVVVVGDGEVLRQVVALLEGDDSISVVCVDDADMTQSDRESRLLSARAALEFHSSRRGYASMTVTHLMARGVPVITNLSAHAPFAGDDVSTTGLVVIDEADGDPVRAVSTLLAPLLGDDRVWLAASTAAKTTAARWTWTDAAALLSQWIDVVDELEPSVVRVVGAVAS